MIRYDNEVQAWWHPELPEKSVDAVKKTYKSKDPQIDIYRAIAWDDSGEKMYGAGGRYTSSKKEPKHEKNKHIGTINVTVRAPYRRQKVATNILRLLAAKAKELGVHACMATRRLTLQCSQSIGALVFKRSGMT